MTTAVQQQIPAATWNVDPIHSTVSFAVKYLASTFRTEFDRYEATLDTTGDEPRLYGSVAPDSIVVKDPNFHAHLQSPDFFDSGAPPGDHVRVGRPSAPTATSSSSPATSRSRARRARSRAAAS